MCCFRKTSLVHPFPAISKEMISASLAYGRGFTTTYCNRFLKAGYDRDSTEGWNRCRYQPPRFHRVDHKGAVSAICLKSSAPSNCKQGKYDCIFLGCLGFN